MTKPHPYTTNIPAARSELTKIAREIEALGERQLAERIRDIVNNQMVRRQGSRRASSTRRKVTSEIERGVLADLRNTDLPQEEIARKYNIDGGRVSEILKRTRN